MYNLRVADIDFRLEYEYPTMLKQAKDYIIDESDKSYKPIFGIILNKDSLVEFQKENPHLSINDCEYLLTGAAFYEKLIEFKGVLLHSSAVVVDGYAYLFSAFSGVGKSTHTGLWLDYFGDKAYILNDDKPALRMTDGRVYAYGTPWSGKTDLNRNVKVPVAGICFIERSQKNYIRRAETFEAFGKFFEQTVRPDNEEKTDLFMGTINDIFCNLPIYIMGCNISPEAVETSYNEMRKGIIK
ncbi:MAG: hypothetical protein LUD77_07245 [Clostridiales bacterium]|nr:hypothetical protein [Clostridiales bacterium]